MRSLGIILASAAAVDGRSTVGRGGTLNTILHQLDERDGAKLMREERKSYPELWYDQVMDHNMQDDARRWKQRYFENRDHYQNGGPVFLMIGGEGEISDVYVGERFLANHLAKTYNGAVLALEHRFYGESQPTKKDLSDLSLLSSQQALSDLGQFTKDLSKHQYAGSKWICLGGSYPGNLAAWYRQLYPELVAGCLSFSAPVFAKIDFFEYGQMVHRALGDGTAEKLLAGYRNIIAEARTGTVDMKKKLLKKANACPYTVVSEEDFAQVEAALTGATAITVQYNNTLPAGKRIEDVCKVVQNHDNDEEAAWAVADLLTPQGADCVDYSVAASYQIFEQYFDSSGKWDSGAAAMRSWVYQTCNEFGYFQTSHVSVNEQKVPQKTLFTSAVSNPALWTGLCKEVFSIEDTETRIAQTRQFYDKPLSGLSNTVFVNGEFDPWSELGRGVFQNPEQGVYGYNIGHGSHCAGLYGSPESDLVNENAKKVQEDIVGIVKGWLTDKVQDQYV